MVRVVQLSRMSVKESKKYFTSLVTKGIHFRTVLTRFTLNKTKSSKGVPYSVVQLENVGYLDADIRPVFKKMLEGLKPMFNKMRVDATAAQDDVVEG